MGHRYQQMDVSTATPEALVAKLFQGAVRHAKRAAELSDASALAERGAALSKVAAIVGELRVSLDHEQGGEIARNLDQLYEFVLHRLTEANLQQQVQPIHDALVVLTTLEEAWTELARRGERGAA